MCQYCKVNSHNFKINICNMCNEMEIATISETEMLNSYGGHTPIQLRIGFQ